MATNPQGAKPLNDNALTNALHLPAEAQALMAQLKGGELTAQLADVQQAMARMSPEQQVRSFNLGTTLFPNVQEQIMSNLSPEQQVHAPRAILIHRVTTWSLQGLANMMKDVDPEAAAGLCPCSLPCCSLKWMPLQIWSMPCRRWQKEVRGPCGSKEVGRAMREG